MDLLFYDQDRHLLPGRSLVEIDVGSRGNGQGSEPEEIAQNQHRIGRPFAHDGSLLFPGNTATLFNGCVPHHDSWIELEFVPVLLRKKGNHLRGCRFPYALSLLPVQWRHFFRLLVHQQGHKRT